MIVIAHDLYLHQLVETNQIIDKEVRFMIDV